MSLLDFFFFPANKYFSHRVTQITIILDSFLRLNYETLFSSFTPFSLRKNWHLYHSYLHKWQLQQINFQQSYDENSECLFTLYVIITVLQSLIFPLIGCNSIFFFLRQDLTYNSAYL